MKEPFMSSFTALISWTAAGDSDHSIWLPNGAIKELKLGKDVDAVWRYDIEKDPKSGKIYAWFYRAPADKKGKANHITMRKKRSHSSGRRIEIQTKHLECLPMPATHCTIARDATTGTIRITCPPLELKSTASLVPLGKPSEKDKAELYRPARNDADETATLNRDQIDTVQELINSLSLPGLGQRVMDYLSARGFDDPQEAIDDLRKAVF